MKKIEQNIIQGLQHRDKEVISILYDRYADALYGVVLRIVGSEEDAKDVMQDAFVKIWKYGASYKPEKGTLFTWILNITRNTAIDKIRSADFSNRAKIQAPNELVSNNIKYSSVWNPEQIGVSKMVDDLDEKYRMVIHLAYFKGYTQKEIADELKIPIGSVKSRVRIAMRELRKKFKTKDLIFLALLTNSLLRFLD